MAGTQLVHLSNTVFEKQWQKDLAAVTKATNPDLVSMVMPPSIGKAEIEKLRVMAERLEIKAGK